MKIAMIGCGKLGLPVALAWASKGHEVVGYDISPWFKDVLASHRYLYIEPGAQALLEDDATRGRITPVDTLREAVAFADIVFVAVQTPHDPAYEGITRVPEDTADFDYSYVKEAVKSLVNEAEALQKHVTVVVISTMLPGTSEREILPIVGKDNKYISFAYAPMFIAQSTVVEDALNPEFVLLGLDKTDARGIEEVRMFFESMHAPEKLAAMSVADAEACKIAYNTMIGFKILAANTWMEICHKTGGNVDNVMNALKRATDRIISPRYMSAGMGDGGGCFVEGELIHVEDGVRAIDEIEKGDRVLGSDGQYHEVIETYRRPFKGKVYTIKGRGLTRFTVTGEHPIHVARDMRKIWSNGRRDQSEGPVLGPIQEVRADELSEDFYVAFPSPCAQSVREMWIPTRGKSGVAPKSINIEGDAYVLIAGYFMGEGSIWFDRTRGQAPRRVTFSFNTKTDGDYIAECVEALKKIVPGAPIKVSLKNDKESCTEVRIDSSMLAKVLDHDCGHGYEDKRIPSWILNDDRNSALCLRALFRGDGSSHADGLSFSTISTHLAHGVSLMLRRHGIPSTLQFHPRRVGSDGVVHRPAFDLGVNNAVFIEKLAEIVGMPIRHQMQDKRYPNYIFERDGVWYHKINSVEMTNYEGTVYNINVADVHNYVSVGGLVSNCHPRDVIALSHLAEQLDLSFDLGGTLAYGRERQTQWLADVVIDETREGKLPVVVLGKAYKPGTNLCIGSPAILLKNILEEMPNLQVYQWDPHVDLDTHALPKVAVYVIATAHEEFFNMIFPAGSVVVDPFGRLANQDGVKIIRVGRH